MLKNVKDFIHVVFLFLKRNEFNILVALLFVLSCFCLVYLLVDCKGTWSLENHSKVNGVHVDTYVNYSDGSANSETSTESTVEDHVEQIDGVVE